MKIVLYTALTGAYDCLNQPKVIDPDFRYICFTDGLTITYNGIWEMRRIPTDGSVPQKSYFHEMVPL